MKPVKMRKDDDCWRACLASILNLDYEDVPEFWGIGENENGEDWVERTQEFLRSYGYGYIEIILGDPSHKSFYCQGYHFIIGASKLIPGVKHAVVGKDGEIVFDPGTREGSGIIPGTEQYAFITIHDPGIEVERLRNAGMRLQAALDQIEEIITPKDKVEEDRAKVGGVVTDYCVDFDEKAVVEKVRAFAKRVEELEGKDLTFTDNNGGDVLWKNKLGVKP